MSIFESVFRISREILENFNQVKINYDFLNEQGKDLILRGPKPTIEKVEKEDNIRRLILKSLTLNSVNYCYWMGSCNFRFNNAGVSKTIELLDEAFFDYNSNTDDLYNSIQKFKQYLIDNRFTLLEERFHHLEQVEINGESFVDLVFYYLEQKASFDFLVETLLNYFPGFAGDIFLKRASLFFIDLYRQANLFESVLSQLPVPADYQVPKVLKHFGFISYDPEIENLIKSEVFIPKTSKIELQIRAATVLACKQLCDVTGWNVSEIDYWFWSKRNEVSDPFHLVLTTDY